MTDKPKKITAGFILSWIFGVLFLLAGIGIATMTPVAGIVIVLCSLLIIPYTNKLTSERMGFEISGGLKFLLVIVIFVAIAISAASQESIQEVDQTELQPTTGGDSTVQEEVLEPSNEVPKTNKKTEYIQNNVKLEEVEVGQGYGTLDIPGYDSPKPTVEGKIRNTGDEILNSVKITVYFLDGKGTRIGEKSYYPISTSSFSDNTPLKPNYVREWGYVVESPPDGWAKSIEVVVSDITFGEDW